MLVLVTRMHPSSRTLPLHHHHFFGVSEAPIPGEIYFLSNQKRHEVPVAPTLRRSMTSCAAAMLREAVHALSVLTVDHCLPPFIFFSAQI